MFHVPGRRRLQDAVQRAVQQRRSGNAEHIATRETFGAFRGHRKPGFRMPLEHVDAGRRLPGAGG